MIRTLEDLRSYCRVDEHTGCWLWPGSTNAYGSPKVNYINASGKKDCACGRRAALNLRDGRTSGRGIKAIPKSCCHERLCINPAHSKLAHPADYGKWQSKKGFFGTMKKKIASRANGKTRAKVTEEQAEEIRRSPLSANEIARRTGIGRSTVQKIRRGDSYRDQVSNASVFSWRPVA